MLSELLERLRKLTQEERQELEKQLNQLKQIEMVLDGKDMELHVFKTEFPSQTVTNQTVNAAISYEVIKEANRQANEELFPTKKKDIPVLGGSTKQIFETIRKYDGWIRPITLRKLLVKNGLRLSRSYVSSILGELLKRGLIQRSNDKHSSFVQYMWKGKR